MYGFCSFDYSCRSDFSELYNASTMAEIYLDEDCSKEQKEEVTKFLTALRDICIQEEKYHTSDAGEEELLKMAKREGYNLKKYEK